MYSIHLAPARDAPLPEALRSSAKLQVASQGKKDMPEPRRETSRADIVPGLVGAKAQACEKN